MDETDEVKQKLYLPIAIVKASLPFTHLNLILDLKSNFSGSHHSNNSSLPAPARRRRNKRMNLKVIGLIGI